MCSSYRASPKCHVFSIYLLPSTADHNLKAKITLALFLLPAPVKIKFKYVDGDTVCLQTCIFNEGNTQVARAL